MAYNPATICRNGHVISNSKKSSDGFCQLCGAPAVTQCLYCGQSIRGTYEASNVIVIGGHYTVPNYCFKCGKPYPWTESAIEATQLLIMEDEELSETDKTKLSDSLPDIIAETPRSSLAAVRVKKALKTAGKFTADALRQFVIDFGCELITKQLLEP